MTDDIHILLNGIKIILLIVYLILQLPQIKLYRPSLKHVSCFMEKQGYNMIRL